VLRFDLAPDAYLRLLGRVCPQRYLRRGVFDHVAIAVADLAASERFYRTVLFVLGAEPSHADAELVEWDDWDIGVTDREHPVTRGLHVGFRAPSREAVDAFWQTGIDAGYREDGAPGPGTIYGPDYYGGFLLDPDGNSAEAVHSKREDRVPDGRVDHLWIRVRDPAASKRFYVTIAPHAGLRIGVDKPDHVQMVGERPSHRAPRSSDANDHIKVLFYDGAIVLDPNEIIICWPRQQDRADRVAIIATNRAAVGAGG